jgi:uncharacterized repeat protein (TIGR03803 family)
MVPVVFEAEPVALFPRSKGGGGFSLSSGAGTQLEGLPPRPDAGFIGRDETLLALDRAFDDHAIVLLHAYAGSGKTTAAAEFARWYRETGGIEGPVLFASFDRYQPLARVLDQFGQAFSKMLERTGGQWLALDDAARRRMALQIMRQVPLLWIWDNVEPVAAFPKGSASKWSAQEQRELADFLRAARETKAKFLLTSRRDEYDWLGDLPARIAVQPMPFQERLELARVLAAKHGRRLTDVEDWRPLLEFTQGNPLAITILVGQALRDGLRTREQVHAFVARLRAGEAVFHDEVAQGRTRSLAASLNYGFEHAFNKEERRQLALLHLFRSFVQATSMVQMAGLSREAGAQLLDRAAEVGLLTTYGGGAYSVHPALPWFFRKFFEQLSIEEQETAVRAYIEAVGSMGTYYHQQYTEGNREVISALKAEELNLLHAWSLGRQHGLWSRVISIMQGLRVLYDHTGRRAEWARLVAESRSDFVDPVTDGPIPGREVEWSLIIDYQARLARESRRWEQAVRLLRKKVDWSRRRRAQSPDRNSSRTLAASLHELAQAQREMDDPESIEAYRESFELANEIDDRAGAATAAFGLGHAYESLPAIHDPDEAEGWYQKSLELTPEGDRMYKASSLAQLGFIAHERFKEGRAGGRPQTELLRYLNDAMRRYHEAMEMTPKDAIIQVSAIHNQLGNLYYDAGEVARALRHYRESIRMTETAGDLYGAAKARFNVAVVLEGAGRTADARQYAEAALRGFKIYGDDTADEFQRTLPAVSPARQSWRLRRLTAYQPKCEEEIPMMMKKRKYQRCISAIRRLAGAIFVTAVIGTPAAQAQTLNTLANFNGANGAYPEQVGSLVQGTDLNFYGVTEEGGAGSNCGLAAGCGTVFSMAPSGALTTLYSFCVQAGCPDGAYPQGGLTQGSDGNFYGTTAGTTSCCGNGPDYGTVFKITPGGVLTTLHSFGGSDGAYPSGTLVQATNGILYGTTTEGGTFSCAIYVGCGTVFRITTAGKFKSLFSFNGATGAYPRGGLIEVKGKLYGAAQTGGTSANCNSLGYPTDGCGTIFSISTGGAFAVLHDFDGYDGLQPPNALVLGSNGSLYGATYSGGGCFGNADGCGTVFRITTAGSLTSLLDFNNDGANPAGTLIQASDGNFYGVTDGAGHNSTGGGVCGSAGYGTIFKITPSGVLTTLYTFSGASDGGCPDGGLIEGSDGNLYGTTYVGGASNLGTVFSLSVGL